MKLSKYDILFITAVIGIAVLGYVGSKAFNGHTGDTASKFLKPAIIKHMY